jgi:Zn-dependent M28 family amino/carboxypeptidase
MKRILLFSLIILNASAFAQKVDKLIQEKNVERVIKGLTADEMMGRSSKAPEQIAKASAFIENEFKNIGLLPLEGLTTFRQEFQKEYVNTIQVELKIDNENIAPDDVVLISEKTDLNLSTGLTTRSIAFSSDLSNKDQYFFDEAFNFIRDTIPALILVDPEFKSNLKELKEMFHNSFVRGRKYDKIFVLGKYNPSNYSLKAVQKIEPLKMNNVVGMLKGKTKPDEMVVFSGHYDHLGIQKLKIDGDSIANGADDDASGTTATIELARYFKTINNNNRTLIFVAFTAEEIGGFGSKHFSQQLDANKIISMFNIEMVGKLAKWGQKSVFITGYDKSDLGSIIQKNLKGSPYHLYPDPYPEQDLFYRSDNATLARLGVPAHTISTDQIPTDSLYHTVNDEFESLDIKNMTDVIKTIAIGSKSIVEGTDTPSRIDKSAVR